MTASTTILPTPGAAFTARTVEAAGFQVRCFEAGDGPEPLIALHGAGGPQFTPALDLLAEQRRVVLVEMPGFGDQPNDRHQTLAELAEAVAETVTALGHERYHLMGTSFGGAVATHLALAHQDRLISLVLDAPALFREGASDPSTVPPQEMVGRFRTHPERVPVFGPPDPEYMARTWPLVDRLLARTPVYDEAVADRLPGLQVRTLVLFGDRDGIIPAENGRTFRRLLPNCSLQFVHDAAHSVQADRPEAFADLVGDWLTRGWGFLVPDDSTVINP